MKIQLLSESTINKIATGEIIDRPLSAVKELVENSIDAGATEILVTLERGGRTLISVSDNGSGISKDNLELAITRYATSKLPDEDVSNIKYMGFRGEALAAIATAGRLKISSKAQESSDAWMISLQSGPDEFEIKPTRSRHGTTVDVRDLFCFMPNRVRFLKPESSEVVACKNLIGALSLAYQQIQFKLIHNQKEIFSSNDCVFDQLLGEDFIENSIKFDTADNYKDITLIKLNGYVSIPTYNRSSHNRIFTFVNRRLIRDNFINKLIRQAYFNALPDGINPSVVLFIDLPPQCIDVNIHPNKSEVRFSDERLVSGAIINTIRDAIKHTRTKNINYIDIKSTFNKQDVTDTQLPLELYFDKNPQPKIEFDRLNHKNLGQAVMQIANKYVISQRGDSLVLVDQHAAHERIVLEKINKTQLKIQDFLLPVEHDFGNAENEFLMSMSSNLQSIGIKITYNEKVIIHSEPLIPGNLDVITLLEDVINNSELWEEIFKSHIDEVLRRVACYSSIRAGRKLTQPEMQNLLLLIENTEFGSQCIHGRPTYLELNISTLDRLFERR